MNQSNYFYKKIYSREKAVTSFINENSLRIKYKLLWFLKTSFFKRYLASTDRIAFEEVKLETSIFPTKYPKEIPNIVYNEIHFLELFKIEEFKKVRKQILKFASSVDVAGWFGYSGKIPNRELERLKESLINLDGPFRTVLFNKLFSINAKKYKKKYDLSYIDFIHFSIIKTEDSFLILQMSVKPSMKFQNEIKKIIYIKGEDTNTPIFHSFFNIIRLRRFVKANSFSMNPKLTQVENLLSDISFQLEELVIDFFKGEFLKIRKSGPLPFIQELFVSNLESLFFNSKIENKVVNAIIKNPCFISSDHELAITSPTNRWDKDDFHISVVVNRPPMINYSSGERALSNIELQEISYSLSVFLAIEKVIFNDLNQLKALKKKIQIYIKGSQRVYLIKMLLNTFYRRSYIVLKLEMGGFLIKFKRYEHEFSNKKLARYLRGFNFNKLVTQEIDCKKEVKFGNYILKSIPEKVTWINNEISKISELFKIVEEINSFRHNQIIQNVSILIAFLALIFTFNEVKEFILKLFNFLF